MADVFISYKAERRPAVHHLARVLKNYGYTVWFDSALLTGDEFRPQIERELRDAKAVVVLWCDLSIHSEWVLDEARLARELKTLVPARIEAVNLPLGYGGLDTIDLAKWDGNPRVGAALDRLLDQIAIKVSRDPKPEFRALSEQEAQWRLHRMGLAEFPLDDTNKKLERRPGKLTDSETSGAPPAVADGGSSSAKHEPDTIAANESQQKKADSALAVRLLINRHTNCREVSRASFSPDSKFIVLPDDRSTASILDCDSGEVVQTLYGHSKSVNNTGKVFSAAYSTDGRRIVTASADHTARVWDSVTGRVLATLSGHTDSVTSATFSADGRRIVTYSSDKTARVWDSETGKLISILAGTKFLFFPADVAKRPVFSPDGRRVVTIGEDKFARIWDAESGQILKTLSGGKYGFTEATFSSDGRRLVTASFGRPNQVWDSATWEVLASNIVKSPPGSARFSPDGRRIVSAYLRQNAVVWDSKTGSTIFELVGHTSYLQSAEFSPDSQRIVTTSSDNTARVWDSETGRCLRTLVGHTERVMAASFSPDGRRVITTSWDKTSRIWDLQ
jgi:WD40 repeat protein